MKHGPDQSEMWKSRGVGICVFTKRRYTSLVKWTDVVPDTDTKKSSFLEKHPQLLSSPK